MGLIVADGAGVDLSETGGRIGRRFVRVDILACVLMLLLALVLMSPGLLPGRVAVAAQQLLVFPPWHSVYPDIQTIQTAGDPLLQQLPWRHWAQQEWAAGRFPLWASSPLGGMPLFASMQPAVLYPLHLLWVLLPIGYGIGIITVLKLWLAGLGMWVLLRTLGIHPAAALLSSLGFMFGTTMVIWSPWQNSAVYLLLPWIAWAVYNWCANNRRSALGWLALLIASAIFGGHPETLFNMSVVVAIWSLGLIVTSPRQHWPRQIGGLALAALIGVGLGAIQLLPFLEAVSLSHEAAIRTNANAYGGLHLFPSAMRDWVLPRSEGQPAEGVLGGVHNFHETNGYVGLVAISGLLLAAVAGLKRRITFRKVLPWAVIGALAWVVTYDDALGRAIRLLPGFNQSLNVRWVWMIGFSVLVVSAFGWDWLAREAGGRWSAVGGRFNAGRLLVALGILFIATGVVLMVAHGSGMVPLPVMEKTGPWYTANDDYRFYWALWAGGVALGVLGAALLWARARLRWIGPMLLAVLLLVDLWSLLFSYVAYAPADQYYPETRFLRDLKSVPPTERIITRFAGLTANSALVYGIRDWRAQDPMLSDRAYMAALLFDPDLPKRPGDNYNMVMSQVRLQIAPMLGIRYVVSSHNPNDEEPEPDRPPISRLEYKEGLGLWRIEGVPGFTYLSDNVQVVPGEAAALAWMKGLTWAQVRAYSAMVEAPPGALAAVHHDPAGTSPGNVQVEEYTSGHIRLRTNALRPALLVVAESWYPGWRATLDGQPVQVLRANYLSQGVVVPTGSHLVQLEYSPDSFRYGQMISLGALLVLAFLVVWIRRDTNVSADAHLHQVPVDAIQPRSNLVLWDKWGRLYLALYILYIGAGMWARVAGWISGDALIFVNAARHVLNGSFDLYSLVVNTASAPPLGTGYSYSPLMALIIAPFVGLADLLGWGQAGAERLMALPLLVIDVVAMHQLRRLVRAWRPAVDEGLVFLDIMITLLLTGFWVATAYAGHDEGLVLLCLLLTLRYLPHNLLLSGLWAGLALAAKQTALLQIMPIGVALMLGAPGMRFADGRDPPSGSQAATRRPLDAFKWSAVALAVFAFFMLPAVLTNPDAVWYAFVTAMSRLAIYGTGLPVWVDNLSQRMLSADGYAWAHEVLVNYSNIALILLVGLASVAAVWKWTKTDPHRQGRMDGLMDTRLLALVAFGGVSQVALGKWVGGHYYALPLALVFIWDIVRTSPVEPHVPRTGELTIHSFPVIGLGAPILFRSLTAFGPGALKDGLLLLLFLGLMLVTFNGAKADLFSELKPSQDS